jgi:hypothetical protein
MMHVEPGAQLVVVVHPAEVELPSPQNLRPSFL